MITRAFLLLFCGTLCTPKSIVPKERNNPRTAQKKFLPQGETSEDDQDPSTTAYLNHTYYDVQYSGLSNWSAIDIATANISKMSTTDDPPPFEVLNIQERGGWFFPFYGHAHQVIYIDANGFVSMVPRYCPHYGFCNWQEPEGHHDSQYQRYIAPMMTDFNPSRFTESNVTYKFTGGDKPKVTIQWTNVVLFSFHNAQINIEKDGFTFQTVLYKSGNIEFNYGVLPYFPGNQTLKDQNADPKKYPMVSGVEDAVIVERGDKHVLADYNPLSLDMDRIFKLYKEHGGVSIKLRALPTCPEFTSCDDCVNKTLVQIKCGWCESEKICADTKGRESSSLSAGCLANNAILHTHQQCRDIGKIKGGDEQNSTMLYVAIAVIIVILVIVVILVVHMVKMKGQLAKYEGGLADSAEAADKTNKVVGLKHVTQPAENKVEMSA